MTYHQAAAGLTTRHELEHRTKEKQARREHELKLVQLRDLPTIKLGLGSLTLSLIAGCVLAWAEVAMGSAIVTTSMTAIVAAGAYLAGGASRVAADGESGSMDTNRGIQNHAI